MPSSLRKLVGFVVGPVLAICGIVLLSYPFLVLSLSLVVVGAVVLAYSYYRCYLRPGDDMSDLENMEKGLSALGFAMGAGGMGVGLFMAMTGTGFGEGFVHINIYSEMNVYIGWVWTFIGIVVIVSIGMGVWFEQWGIHWLTVMGVPVFFCSFFLMDIDPYLFTVVLFFGIILMLVGIVLYIYGRSIGIKSERDSLR